MRKITSLVVALLVLAGCGLQPGGTGRVEVLLTDAPAAEADSLVVSFGRVDLVPHEDDEAGIRTVTDSAGEIDVLTLQNGETRQLGEIPLDAGTYHQLRLIVDEAHLHFGEEGSSDEEVYPVTIPSGARTGLKINVEPPLVVADDGATSQVVVDFDASRAVIETPPGSGNYVLKPTGVRAVTESGVLEGRVVAEDSGDPVDGASVEIYADDASETTAEALTSEDGVFRVITLLEGDYDLVVLADEYEELTVEDVAVSVGETTDLGELTLTPVPSGE